ncbi:MAG: HdeD family acid-resistance protein [Christensenellaceae bacterium]
MSEIKKFFTKLKWEKLVTAIVAIVLGIVFVADPNGSGDAVCKVAGVAMIVLAAAMLIRYFTSAQLFPENLIFSAVLLLLGIFFIAKSGVVMTVLGLFFGIFLVIDGASKIRDGIDAAKAKMQGWWIWFILALLTIVLGVLVMFGESVMTLLGVSLIVDGVSDIVTTLWLSAGVRKVKKEIEKDEKDLGEMDEVK